MGRVRQLERSPSAARDAAAVAWLIACAEPGIRLQAQRDLLDRRTPDDAANVADGPWVRALLAGQQADGSFGNHPYAKWTGAHWRLVSLVELGLPAADTRALAAYETVLLWLLSPSHVSNVRRINGRYRRCASQEGNALAVGVRLGLADDPRLQRLAASLTEWQWPDGGWNCDRRPAAAHSSFNETVTPLWGLAEYAQATGEPAAGAAAAGACELLLDHHVFRSHRTGEVANARWLELSYPVYWRYDLLQGLLMLGRAGALPDKRAADGLAMLRGKQGDEGRWQLEGTPYWRPSGSSGREVVDWGRSGPSLMLTLNALRVLRAAGLALA